MTNEREREIREIAAGWLAARGMMVAGHLMGEVLESYTAAKRERDRLREENETLRFLLRGGCD